MQDLAEAAEGLEPQRASYMHFKRLCKTASDQKALRYCSIL
ncbi:hypothetical protein Ngar_c34010 [Candidatus Nitrososphaera gargensis Ga9.2]|uniref:Uncharacterized protein n=1 Tax=Nitrososphaera gargensis (strain Ga9.2) TaxID=1237085 RepID=K0IFY9_NITGG|nr:hypothetical protein Ngar_c34010 [Candidatus Nitrososphaera gargensis Ga9.2]